ncbi:MAG: glycosyltransferase family 4 protein, partial [Nanoarchaeota archaeon]|nr:glycosyltransferase family 4 protein [Nanoarchaeota archaeon]
QLLAERGHEVVIMSSYFEKGTNKIMPLEDSIGKVNIRRFPASKLGGESFMSWPFEKKALEFKPDVIIAHGYRHPHTTRALCLKKKIKCKVFLVTHAPFARDRREIFGKIAVRLYDFYVGRKNINNFDKIFAITYWEYLYLAKLNVREDKIEYVPNGIAKEYFSKITEKRNKKILYSGRIAPIKNLEVVIKALKNVKDKRIKFYIFGPAEKRYLDILNKIISENGLDQKVKIDLKTYDRKQHIKELDKSSIFILPSFSEGMSQSLIEAMARECIVIGSDNLGNADLIKDEENGFLFKNDDESDLTKVIDSILNMNEKEILRVRNNARESVEKFRWSQIINNIERLIRI